MTIIEYLRPGTMDAAVKALSRKTPRTVPLGGGTDLPHNSKEAFAVVDLQGLGLNKISQEGAFITVGATATLQSVFDAEIISPVLAEVIRLEATSNRRQIATLGGTLIASNGRSPLATIFMAMDANLVWEPGGYEIGFGDWLAVRDSSRGAVIDHPGLILVTVKWPARMELAFHKVSRTPADLPLLCVAVAGWASGRRRIVAGGYGRSPILVMDGPEGRGAEEAVRSAVSNAGDEWASAEYRQETAWTLTRRCLIDLAPPL